MSKITVFLGGTCNESLWRDQLISLLNDNIEAFNPVVPDWNEQAYQKELAAREHSDYVLYVITPKMTGVYSIAEVVDDSNKRPYKTLFAVLAEDNGVGGFRSFDKGQFKSLQATRKLIVGNGAQAFDSLQEIADFLNNITHTSLSV